MAFRWWRGGFPKFPYTNFHEANLDYFLSIFSEIWQEWEELYSGLTEWKDTTEEEFNTWKTNLEDAIEQWETVFTAQNESWKSNTQGNIEQWEFQVISDLNAWKTEATAAFEAIRVQAAASATNAATSATAAGTAKTAAEAAQTAAETAAASISASATQITTNTGDISDLKSALKPLAGIVQFESGSFLNDHKTKGVNAKRIRNVTPIPLKNYYRVKIPTGYTAYIFYFDKDMTFISSSPPTATSYNFGSEPTGAYYANFAITKTGHENDDISADIPTLNSNTEIILREDTTNNFTVQNRPADAKAVGDWIAHSFADVVDMPSGTDFNTLKTRKCYRLIATESSTYINSALPAGHRGYMFVLKSDTHAQNIQQIIFDPENGIVYQRFYAASTWYNWKSTQYDDSNILKLALGTNPYRKASDHGGFWNRPSEAFMEDSPLAFLRASKEGIMFHNVDIVCSSDGVPFASHNNTVTDTSNVSHIISQNTAETVKTWTIGNSTYSFTLLTLAELNKYIKKLGGVIDTVDVSYMTDAQAAALKAYYNTHNINPAWTNFDSPTQRTAFKNASGGEFGLYIACESTSDIEAALLYIESNQGPDYMLNIYASSSGIGTDAVEPYVKDIRDLNAKIYVFIYNNLTNNEIPEWADGVMSETININYEERKNTING